MAAANRGMELPTRMLQSGGGSSLQDTKNSGISYLLTLQFLGLGGLQANGWLERAPGYELIVQAGGHGRRVIPRIPAPPPGIPGNSDEVDLKALMPDCDPTSIVRLDERLSLRLPEPAPLLQVDVWEERSGLFDFAGRGPEKRLVGHCYVPLEPRFNRRPCTWSIVSQAERERPPHDVGFLTIKFGLATSPLHVRNLRIVEGVTASSELALAWDPPTSDGGMPLRCYRIEAHLSAQKSAEMNLYGEDEPRTASAQPSAKPSVVMRGLQGNRAYKFRVWATSEAGPGPSAEILGFTGPVAPGICGTPHVAIKDPLNSSDAEPVDNESIVVQWKPPSDTGGAPVMAYRMWLRPLFQDAFGNVFPADGWIDLGLLQHKGEPTEMQTSPIQRDAMPICSGCLCSVAALNTAGHLGPSTHEETIFFDAAPSDTREIFEVNSPASGASAANSRSELGGSHAPDMIPLGHGCGHNVTNSPTVWAQSNLLSAPEAWTEDFRELPPPRRCSPITSSATGEVMGLADGASDLYSQGRSSIPGSTVIEAPLFPGDVASAFSRRSSYAPPPPLEGPMLAYEDQVTATRPQAHHERALPRERHSKYEPGGGQTSFEATIWGAAGTSGASTGDRHREFFADRGGVRF